MHLLRLAYQSGKSDIRFLSISLSCDEVEPGDNIGLVASKTSATAVRGQYYGIAAAMGKAGAFVGTCVLPIIQNNAPNEVRSGSVFRVEFAVPVHCCVCGLLAAAYRTGLSLSFFPRASWVSIGYHR